MKVLTAAQMREVDRRTIELGIPGLVLMENAGHRVVEFLEETFAPLAEQRIVDPVRQGQQRRRRHGGGAAALHPHPSARARRRAGRRARRSCKGDAAENFRMLAACGCPVAREITPEMRGATIVIDALLGTGLKGPASGRDAAS